MVLKRLNQEKYYYFIFIIISAIFFLTRLFRLDSVPFTVTGLHADEFSAAYDAWCIQGWGVDRHLTRFPVYFMNTGPGQNSLYIYLAAIIFKFFGFSVFRFRLVAVICAAIAYICLFLLSGKIIGTDIYSLIPNALMTVMPVFLMSEHWGLESYLFLSFSIISFSLLIISIEKKKITYFVIDGIAWGITFYTYGMSYVVLPLFLISCMIYLIYVKEINIRMILAMGIPIVLLGVPLAVEQLVIAGIAPPFSIGPMDFFPMDKSRAGELSLSNIPSNLISSFKTIFVEDYMFYNGDARFGTIFYISIPFMIIGMSVSLINIINSLKRRTYSFHMLIFLFYLIARIVSLMTFMVNINKANEIYFPYLLFTTFGIIFTSQHLDKKLKLPIALGTICAVYAVTFCFFSYWIYSGGENSWNHKTMPRYEEDIIYDTHIGYAVQDAQSISSGRPIQIIINALEFRYDLICLFAGTSPYDYVKEGYNENNYDISVPDELDLSGDVVYLIDGELHHITDYLVSEGFTNHVARYGEFSIVYK